MGGHIIKRNKPAVSTPYPEVTDTVKQRVLYATFFISLSISAALLFFLVRSMSELWLTW